jgi:hypothetical protein
MTTPYRMRGEEWREVEITVEEYVKVGSHERNETFYCLEKRRKMHCFVRGFLCFALSSF